MKELIIGREAGVPKEQARLAIQMGGKTYFVGNKGSVPNNVSRQHCKISLSGDNKMTVENMTENNLLYINGKDCRRKEGVTLTDRIELGPDKFFLDVEAILKPLSANQSYSIKHLEKIQNEYLDTKMSIQVKQGKMNAAAMIPSIISLLSMLLMVVWESTIPRLVLGTFALGGMVFILFFRNRTAKSTPKKMKELEDKYRDDYICPNPACNHFLGMTPYKELIKNHSCPYCKCKFTE